MNIDKSLILNELKKHFNFKKELEFANFLGIKPQTLASWHSRNVYDIEILYEKCNQISADWLLTGRGEMLRGVAEKTENCNEKLKPLQEQLQFKDEQLSFYKEKIELLTEKLENCQSEKKLIDSNKHNV